MLCAMINHRILQWNQREGPVSHLFEEEQQRTNHITKPMALLESQPWSWLVLEEVQHRKYLRPKFPVHPSFPLKVLYLPKERLYILLNRLHCCCKQIWFLRRNAENQCRSCIFVRSMLVHHLGPPLRCDVDWPARLVENWRMDSEWILRYLQWGSLLHYSPGILDEFVRLTWRPFTYREVANHLQVTLLPLKSHRWFWFSRTTEGRSPLHAELLHVCFVFLSDNSSVNTTSKADPSCRYLLASTFKNFWLTRVLSGEIGRFHSCHQPDTTHHFLSK